MHKILLVDDMRSFLDLEATFLARAEVRILTASTGLEGIRVARAERPDLVVLDIQLPGMDGLEVLARLRAAAAAPPPVLALTALAMSGDRERILAAGADAYLAKPAPLAVLEQEVRRLAASRGSSPNASAISSVK